MRALSVRKKWACSMYSSRSSITSLLAVPPELGAGCKCLSRNSMAAAIASALKNASMWPASGMVCKRGRNAGWP